MKILVHSRCKNRNKGNLDKKTLICKGCGKRPDGESVTLVRKKEGEYNNKKRYNPREVSMRNEINNPGLFEDKRTHYGYSRV